MAGMIGTKGAAGIVATVGAAGAAVYGGLQLRAPQADEISTAYDNAEICFVSDFAAEAGVGGDCVTRGALRSLMAQPLARGDGEVAALGLSHPTDDLAPVRLVNSCSDYFDLKKQGWYPLTGREMRREGYFVRTCGAMRMLVDSAPPSESFLDVDGCDESDMRAALAAEPIGFGESAEPAADISQTEAGVWRASTATADVVLHEIALADFNGDGAGDMLVFLAMGASGGSASASMLGYIEKPGADATAFFTPAE